MKAESSRFQVEATRLIRRVGPAFVRSTTEGKLVRRVAE